MTVGEWTRIKRRRTHTIKALLKQFGLEHATVAANPYDPDETFIEGLGDGEAVARFLAELEEHPDVKKVGEAKAAHGVALEAFSVLWEPQPGATARHPGSDEVVGHLAEQGL